MEEAGAGNPGLFDSEIHPYPYLTFPVAAPWSLTSTFSSRVS
jgi:hypothetical protein